MFSSFSLIKVSLIQVILFKVNPIHKWFNKTSQFFRYDLKKKHHFPNLDGTQDQNCQTLQRIALDNSLFISCTLKGILYENCFLKYINNDIVMKNNGISHCLSGHSEDIIDILSISIQYWPQYGLHTKRIILYWSQNGLNTKIEVFFSILITIGNTYQKGSGFYVLIIKLIRIFLFHFNNKKDSSVIIWIHY